MLLLLCLPLLVRGESCGISEDSRKIVDSCPVNLTEWSRQSIQKNCASFYKHHNCSEPETYVYHCVKNHFRNSTIEVCAQKRQIFFGYCAEYNILGRLIQINYDAECHQCPYIYWSTDAYKYQECYSLTSLTKEQDVTTKSGTWNIATSDTTLNFKTTPFPHIDSTYVREIVGSAVSAVLIVVIVVILKLWKWKRKRRQKAKQLTSIEDGELLPTNRTATLQELANTREQRENDSQMDHVNDGTLTGQIGHIRVVQDEIQHCDTEDCIDDSATEPGSESPTISLMILKGNSDDSGPANHGTQLQRWSGAMLKFLNVVVFQTKQTAVEADTDNERT